MKVLWADDDSFGLLQALGRILERTGGFSVHKAMNFKDALGLLKDAYPSKNKRFRSLLVDIILPEAQGGGSLATDLGIRLAQSSIGYGVRSVAFLTVVRQDEVLDKYLELERDFPQVRFSFFDKTNLLSRGEIEELISRLRVDDEDEEEEEGGSK